VDAASQFMLDASYSKMRLDSTSGILLFLGPDAPSSPNSNQVYISNIHAANPILRLVVAKRVDLYLGYRLR
jgi:hypothetical protein